VYVADLKLLNTVYITQATELQVVTGLGRATSVTVYDLLRSLFIAVRVVGGISGT
jgi:hypothetical protein